MLSAFVFNAAISGALLKCVEQEELSIGTDVSRHPFRRCCDLQTHSGSDGVGIWIQMIVMSFSAIVDSPFLISLKLSFTDGRHDWPVRSDLQW